MGAHKAPLVYHHLETVSRDVLEEYREMIKGHVRNKNGVYALYNGDKLYYVGLAKNLRGRLDAHLKNKHAGQWDKFSVYLTTGDRHLRELEALVMRIAQPRGNTQKGKLTGSVNLMKILERDLKDSFKAEIARLSGKKAKAPQVVRTKSDGRPKGMLAQYPGRPTRLKAKLKGKTIYAVVRKDGFIRFNGKVYETPSGAGCAACGRSCNGWSFWTYEKVRGYWVPLADLRN